MLWSEGPRSTQRRTEPPGGPSLVRSGVRKCWAWVTFFRWMEAGWFVRVSGETGQDPHARRDLLGEFPHVITEASVSHDLPSAEPGELTVGIQSETARLRTGGADSIAPSPWLQVWELGVGHWRGTGRGPESTGPRPRSSSVCGQDRQKSQLQQGANSPLPCLFFLLGPSMDQRMPSHL